MCLKLWLMLSHVPAPKPHTSQQTIHRYVHSWNDLAQPVPDPPNPLLQHHPASPCQSCLPGLPSQPIRPAVPPDPISHARRPCPPCQQTRLAKPANPPCRTYQPPAAGTSPLPRPRCSRPFQPSIFQLPAHQRQLAHFPLLLSKNVAISGDPLKMLQLQE